MKSELNIKDREEIRTWLFFERYILTMPDEEFEKFQNDKIFQEDIFAKLDKFIKKTGD